MTTLTDVRRALREASDPAHAVQLQRFFKTAPGQYGAGDRFLGVRMGPIRRLVPQTDALPLADLDALLDSPLHEERMLALLGLARRYQRGDARERQRVYDLYLGRTERINNWDLVDVTAPHVVGAHLSDRDRGVLRRLARSASLWERRIAVLATFHFIARGEFDDSLWLAEHLLQDREDLIHKAVGWMLREVGKRGGAAQLRSFLDEHAARMPRTMLRYAIERFPPAERRRYLGRPRLARARKRR